MHHLVFTSSATIPLTNIDVLNLLRSCRGRNHKNGITGMLIYIEGNFIEAIEGPEAAVKNLFSSIEKDSRHHEITVLFEETFANDTLRSFPNWSMGLRNFEELRVANIEGLNTYVQHVQFSGRSYKPTCLCWELLRKFCECNH